MDPQEWLFKLDDLLEKYNFEQCIEDEFFIVTHLFTNDDLRNDLKSWLEQLKIENYKVKSSENGNEWKLKGNEYFNKKEYKEALICYNMCLEFSPRESICFSLGLGNRASVFIEMQKYQEALNDTKLLFSLNKYPIENLYKIYVKEVKCYNALGNSEKRKIACENAIKYLSNHSGYSQKEIGSIKRRLISMTQNNVESSMTEIVQETLPVLQKEMKYLNGASNMLSLKYVEDKGRHIIAKCNLKEDDLLFVEAPFAFISLPLGDTLKKVCNNCGVLSEYIIVCHECCDSYYCSEECRIKGWTEFHQWECEGSKICLWSSIGIAHLALRVIFKAMETSSGLNYFEDLKTSSVKSILNHMNMFENITTVYGKIFHLNTNQSNICRTDLIKYAMTSIMISMYLLDYTNFSEQFKTKLQFKSLSSYDIILFITCLLYKHMLQMICNASVIHANKLKNANSSTDSETIGVGIYPSSSMMNHSCVPNTKNSYYKNVFIVRAAKNISEGHEVFNCYGPRAEYENRIDRQTSLKGQYGFDCKCEACSEM